MKKRRTFFNLHVALFAGVVLTCTQLADAKDSEINKKELADALYSYVEFSAWTEALARNCDISGAYLMRMDVELYLKNILKIGNVARYLALYDDRKTFRVGKACDPEALQDHMDAAERNKARATKALGR